MIDSRRNGTVERMTNPGRGMRLGFVEPHLACFGGIRRMVEFANRLVARGHDVTFYLPPDVELRCSWMPCDAAVKPITAGFWCAPAVLSFNHAPPGALFGGLLRPRPGGRFGLLLAPPYPHVRSWGGERPAGVP